MLYYRHFLTLLLSGCSRAGHPPLHLGAPCMTVRAVFRAEGTTLSLKDPWDDLDLTIEGQLR